MDYRFPETRRCGPERGHCAERCWRWCGPRNSRALRPWGRVGRRKCWDVICAGCEWYRRWFARPGRYSPTPGSSAWFPTDSHCHSGSSSAGPFRYNCMFITIFNRDSSILATLIDYDHLIHLLWNGLWYEIVYLISPLTMIPNLEHRASASSIECVVRMAPLSPYSITYSGNQ